MVWGEQAVKAAPYNSSAYGVLGDALVEVGRYPEAFRTFQRMIDLRPDLSSYARASYARELQGDVAGAISDMELALEAASWRSDAAFAGFQLGELWFNSGHLDRAQAAYARAAAVDPAYVPAHEGLAKVAAAQGRIRSDASSRRVPLANQKPASSPPHGARVPRSSSA